MDLYQLVKPLIYKLQPEQAHHLTIAMLQMGGGIAPGRWLIQAMFHARQNGPEVKAFGLTFPNPLGMAAGYDKDGLGWRGLAGLGFGHIEVGTVTPKAQPGNPTPRCFRLVPDEAVINRMGFPNRGADFLARRLRFKRPKGLILGVNIGKNKVTPLEEAANDYVVLVEQFAPLADYLAVNVSSPNTPDLRKLQAGDALTPLLSAIQAAREAQTAKLGRKTPVLVKLAPDLSAAELDAALDAIVITRMDGVIIGNTTISRPALQSPMAGEIGGLSGKPLSAINQAMVGRVVKLLDGKLPVVASGGVMTPADAQARLDAGATLVQLYSGLIYSGPALVQQILNAGLKLSH